MGGPRKSRSGHRALRRSVERYDGETALLIVDVQNDFAHPDGSLYVRGAEEILPVLNRELELARSAGALVVYTQDWHPPTTPHFKKHGGVWPVHCVKNTWGALLHPELHCVSGAKLVRKGQWGEDGYSAFSVRDPVSGTVGTTELDEVLRTHEIRRVVIAGLATDYCVKETALDALFRGYEVMVLGAAVRAVNLRPGDGQRALEEISRRGAEVIDQDVVLVLPGASAPP
jgi:nicotinamidase/pyrazinamidase